MIYLKKFFVYVKSGYFLVVIDKEISQCTIVELNGEHKISHSGDLISIIAEGPKKNNKDNSKNSKSKPGEIVKVNLLLLKKGEVVFEIKDVEGGVYGKTKTSELLY